MSMTLDEINQGLKNLSVVDLENLIEKATEELHRKTSVSNTSTSENIAERGIRIPGLYRPTKEQIEKRLKATFTPEQLEALAKFDPSQLPPLPKTITEYIDEDREDRF